MKTYLRECRWGTFMLLRGDRISQYVDMYGEWVEVEVELFRQLLPEGGVCIEVGSNLGMHAVPLSKFCCQGKLYCYEPQRPIFHILCGNLALNNCLNVVARHLAVDERPGRLDIETGDYDVSWNYGSFSLDSGFSTEDRFVAQTRIETVEVISLDEDPALAELTRVDLLKIDVEGAEARVLRGARRLIARHRPFLFVEANKARVVDEILSELCPQGYSAYWFVSARYRQENFNLSPFETPGIDTNILFCPTERGGFEGKLVPVQDFGDLERGVPIYTGFH